jgi:hypothetical protein
MLNRSKAWAIALLAAVFVVGAAAGWCLRGWTAEGREPRYRDTNTMVAYLAKELSLSAAQRDSVRAVLGHHRGELEALWREVHPRFDSLRTVMRAEISAALTPAQQSRYRDLVVRAERQRRAADSARTGRR